MILIQTRITPTVNCAQPLVNTVQLTHHETEHFFRQRLILTTVFFDKEISDWKTEQDKRLFFNINNE